MMIMLKHSTFSVIKKTLLLFVFLILSSQVHAQTTAAEFIKKGIDAAKNSNHKEAIKNFDYALTISPNDFNIYVYRAFAKESLKDYKGAIEDYDKAISITPKDPNIYYNRALAKYSSGDKKNACKDWQKAIDLGMSEAVFIIQLYCH